VGVKTTEARPSTRKFVAGVRTLLRALPVPVRRRLEDRVFYAVHQLTRVTNDHYPGANPSTPPPESGDYSA
jgi:hypothetical protein